MASSQVELAASSPFGCVLRAACQRKIKDFVTERVVDENIQHGHHHVEKNVKKMDNQYKKPRCSLHASDFVNNDKFDERCCCMSQSQRENSACVDDNDDPDHDNDDGDGDGDISNLAASSLVQIWEARLRRPSSGDDVCYSRSNSGCSDNASSLVDEDVKVPECVEEEKCVEDGSISSRKSEKLDSLEIERVRVADIVKRWSSADNENDGLISPGNSPLMRFCGCDQRVFAAQVISSPRIRGRQAFNDLLMLLERDRHRELEALATRRAVSKFPQKGRIQSMLRLKVLQRGLAAKSEAQSQNRPSSDGKRLSHGSHIKQLRERFRADVQQGVKRAPCDESNPKSPQKECINSNQVERSPTVKLYEDRCNQDTLIVMKSEEIFQACDEPTSMPVNEVYPRSEEEIMSGNFQRKTEFSSTGVPKEESCHREVITPEQRSKTPVEHPKQPPLKDIFEKPNSSSEVTCQELSSEACELKSQGHSDDSVNLWQGTSWDSGSFFRQENAPDIMYLNDWDENEVSEEDDEVDDDQLMETNYDWISDIARPRSYWEECRIARYQEVFSTDSSKEEIRRLLERGTVSNFLTSDLRDRIDQLMESRLQVTFQASIQDEDDSKERLEQMMRSLQRDKQSVGTDKEGREEEDGEVERIDAEKNLINQQQCEIIEEEKIANIDCQQGDESSAEEVALVEERHPHHSEEAVDNDDDEMEDVAGADFLDQYHEASDYFDQSTPLFQMPSPSHSSSWSYRVGESGENSDQAASSISNPLLQSESYYRDTRHTTPCRNRSPIEMEIINDMREKMDVLQQEILELRRSIKFCLDMQLEMQQSIKQEVYLATMEGENAINKRRRKSRCCVCNEMQVDSLLSRCGHMCTCLKCANELQLSSGKCPICHAPIDDVVKANACS